MFEMDPATQVMAFFFVVTVIATIWVRWQLYKDRKHKS